MRGKRSRSKGFPKGRHKVSKRSSAKAWNKGKKVHSANYGTPRGGRRA